MIRISVAHASYLVETLRNAGLLENETLKEIETLLVEQMNGGNMHNADVLDVVAGILSHRNAQSAITGDLLVRMRNAIFSPKELAALRSMHGKNEVVCKGCSTNMPSGSIITKDGESVYCWRCLTPQLVQCGCGMRHDIQNGVSRIIQKAVRGCPNCLELAKKLAEPAEPAEVRARPARPRTAEPVEPQVFWRQAAQMLDNMPRTGIAPQQWGEQTITTTVPTLDTLDENLRRTEPLTVGDAVFHVRENLRENE